MVEKIVWTALPNHLDQTGRLRLSVYVSPRLMNDDGSSTSRKLGDFPAFSSWPERLATLKFRVEFDGGPSPKGVVEVPADPALWKRLFPLSTPVRPHAFKDHGKRSLHVFPVRGVLQFLETTYGALGAAGTTLPSIDDPTGPLAPFGPLGHLTSRITDSQSFYEELARGHQREGKVGQVVSEDVADSSLPPAQQAVQNTFFQAYRFYYRPGSQRPDFPADHVEPPPAVPEFDFHQMIAHLADHPRLLRMLGLVVDLVVDLPNPHQQIPAQGIVRVLPVGNLPETPPACPGTRYELHERWFGARPKSSRMARGLARLHPEFYDLFQVDVDGAALQVVGFADTLRRLRDPERRGPASPGEAAAPALRSAGLALTRVGRGQLLLEGLLDKSAKNALIEAAQPVVLDAEDLVRGYRVDVRDDDSPGGPRWFSLHRRHAEHEVKAAAGAEPLPPIEVVDEGYLKATAASGERADHPAASDDLYLHETVVGWEGWSLSAPRPGKRIVEPGAGDGHHDSREWRRSCATSSPATPAYPPLRWTSCASAWSTPTPSCCRGSLAHAARRWSALPTPARLPEPARGPTDHRTGWRFMTR